MIYGYVIILIMSFILTISIIIWIWLQDPKSIISWWNNYIKNECDLQDIKSLNGIPSYHNAWNSSNKTITELHKLIHINHDSILQEINNMNNDKDRIWIKFMGDWTGLTNKFPTLKNICSLFPDVSNLYVAIFNPGTTMINEQNTLAVTHKYHYGLKVPKNDIGLKILGFDVKWEQGEGFVWNDSFSHSIWNHTTEQRIIIFADVFRDFSFINSVGSKLIYSLFQRSPEILTKRVLLQEEDIILRT